MTCLRLTRKKFVIISFNFDTAHYEFKLDLVQFVVVRLIVQLGVRRWKFLPALSLSQFFVCHKKMKLVTEECEIPFACVQFIVQMSC